MRRFPRNVIVTTIASLLTDVSTEMVVYLLPIFLSTILHTPTTIIGLIEGVAETTTAFAKLFSGYLSDRAGTRKWFAVFGYALSTVAKAFVALAYTWQVVFASRFMERLGKGIRNAPRDALIADSVDERSRGAAFGFHRAGDTLGAFIGVGLALVIVLATQEQTALLTRSTFDAIVWLSLIPATIAVIVLIVGVREIRPTTRTAPPKLTLAGFDRRFKWFLVVMALFTMGNSADAFIVLRAEDRGAGVPLILLMVLGFNLIYTVLATPLGRLSDKVGRRRLILVGWGVYAAVYFGFGLASEVWQIAILWACYGLYYALTEGQAKALVADLMPGERRGTAYGMFNATVGLVALPASLIAGALWQVFGPPAPFVFGALMAGLAGLLLGITAWRC